jgi:DNA-binding NtrC family response regulator
MSLLDTQTTTATDQRKSIVIVDDEILLLRALARQLASQHDVELVEDAASAMEILEQRPVDVLVSDLNMPALLGTDLLRQVAQRHPSVRRVLMSTDRPADLDALLAEGNVEHFLEKPLTHLPRVLEAVL